MLVNDNIAFHWNLKHSIFNHQTKLPRFKELKNTILIKYLKCSHSSNNLPGDKQACIMPYLTIIKQVITAIRINHNSWIEDEDRFRQFEVLSHQKGRTTVSIFWFPFCYKVKGIKICDPWIDQSQKTRPSV